MDAFFIGTIPAYYREVFQTLCPDPHTSSRVDKDVLQKILAKSGLSDANLASVSYKDSFFNRHFSNYSGFVYSFAVLQFNL